MFQRFVSSIGVCFLWSTSRCDALFAYRSVLLFSLCVLMPVDLVGNNRHRSPFDDQYVEGLSIISMSNIDSKNQKHLLWPHFFSVRTHIHSHGLGSHVLTVRRSFSSLRS